jgi:hypothetical protein
MNTENEQITLSLKDARRIINSVPKMFEYAISKQFSKHSKVLKQDFMQLVRDRERYNRLLKNIRRRYGRKQLVIRVINNGKYTDYLLPALSVICDDTHNWKCRVRKVNDSMHICHLFELFVEDNEVFIVTQHRDISIVPSDISNDRLTLKDDTNEVYTLLYSHGYINSELASVEKLPVISLLCDENAKDVNNPILNTIKLSNLNIGIVDVVIKTKCTKIMELPSGETEPVTIYDMIQLHSTVYKGSSTIKIRDIVGINNLVSISVYRKLSTSLSPIIVFTM